MPRNFRRPMPGRPRGFGNYGESDPNSNPPDFYREKGLFNGPEGFELINGPRRAITQFPFQAGPVATQILAENYRRFYLILQNLSVTDIIFFGFAQSVNATTGFGLTPGAVGPPVTPGGNLFSDYMCPTDAIWVFCAVAATAGICAEGVLVS